MTDSMIRTLTKGGHAIGKQTRGRSARSTFPGASFCIEAILAGGRFDW